MKSRNKSCNYIYGLAIKATCKRQINVNDWKGKEPYNQYVVGLLQKDSNFFKIWTRLNSIAKCSIEIETDEELDDEVLQLICTEKDSYIKGNRIIIWSRDSGFEPSHVPSGGRGHGKQGDIFNDYTYCVKDRGMHWKERGVHLRTNP